MQSLLKGMGGTCSPPPLDLPLTYTASSSSGKIEAGFWVMLFHGPRLLLCGPYYTALSFCMMADIKYERVHFVHGLLSIGIIGMCSYENIW